MSRFFSCSDKNVFQTINNVQVYENYVNHDSTNNKKLSNSRKNFLKHLQLLLTTSIHDKLKTLTSLIIQPSKPLVLDEYRKIKCDIMHKNGPVWPS